MNIQNKTITIIGAQKSGIAAAKLALFHGAKVKISDAKDELSHEIADWAQAHNLVVELGGQTEDFIRQSDYVVLSPGVPFSAPAVKWARQADIPVLGEIEFAFQFCPKPVIGVTGSNGKTTVSTLIYDLLKRAGYKAGLCGNIGTPFSQVVLDENDLDCVVIELSSFQLESMVSKDDQKRFALKGFKPAVAVLLNLNQNHLDRHRDMVEYFEAKLNIFANQTPDDHALINYDLRHKGSFVDEIVSGVHFFNIPEDVQINPNAQAISAIANMFNIDKQHVMATLQNFKGVEHRLEYVAVVGGIRFVNDSKSTTIESGRWALKNTEGPVVLLCGGKDKNLDFTVIAGDVAKYTKAVIAYGQARKKIIKAFEGHPDISHAATLKEAFDQAVEKAEDLDCILLSPMCASFDEFSNFEERGAYFKELVRERKNQGTKEGSAYA